MSQAHHDPADFSAQQPTQEEAPRPLWAPRPKPQWPPEDFSQEAFEQRRKERLEEIRLYFEARAAAERPGRDAGATSTPPAVPLCFGVAPAPLPGNRGASDPSAPVVSVESTPTLPGREAGATSTPPVVPASLPGRPPAPPPIYLAVPDAPPPPERPLKRQPPALGKLAPFPRVQRASTAGAWAERLAALDTATDLFYTLLVGINAIIELRHEHWQRLDWEEAQPLRPRHAVLQQPMPVLWERPQKPWEAEGTLSMLRTEIEQFARVLEVAPVTESAPLGVVVEALRQEAIEVRLKRLEQVAARLRKQMHKRRAARRVAEMLAQIAWRSLETLFLPELPARRPIASEART